MKASSSRSQKLFKTIFTSMAAPDIEPTGSGLDTDRQARSRLRHAVGGAAAHAAGYPTLPSAAKTRAPRAAWHAAYIPPFFTRFIDTKRSSKPRVPQVLQTRHPGGAPRMIPPSLAPRPLPVMRAGGLGKPHTKSYFSEP